MLLYLLNYSPKKHHTIRLIYRYLVLPRRHRVVSDRCRKYNWYPLISFILISFKMVNAHTFAVSTSVIVAVFAAISGYYLSLPQLAEGLESPFLTRAFAWFFLFVGDLVSILDAFVYVSLGLPLSGSYSCNLMFELRWIYSGGLFANMQHLEGLYGRCVINISSWNMCRNNNILSKKKLCP